MKKILVVDDDTIFLKTMRDMLEPMGFTVIEAKDGVEGLAMVEKEKPNLILLDVVMPKLDGMGFLKALQKEEEGKQIPVLITSNFSGTNKIEEGMQYGIRGYIIKSNESLKTIINNIELIIGKAD